MDQLNCRVCGSSFYNQRLIYDDMPRAAQNFPDDRSVVSEKGERLTIRQCSGCGLIQSTSALVSYYRDVIRAAAFSPAMAAFRLKQFSELDSEYGFSAKRTIELGSGRGEYLQLMQNAGWDVWGLEHMDSSVSAALESGFRVQKGYVGTGDYELEEGPFEAFVTFNYLEHIPNIDSFLAGISNNLVSGGIGLIEVPNFDMMYAESMSTEFIADHLYYFTETTLRRTLEINGFDVMNIGVTWHGYIISAVVKKRQEISFNNFLAQDAQLRKELISFLQTHRNERVAVWGAGHQALATIAMTKIADQLAYVIDSAPFKQNKFTPATHIPIVAPEILESDPVETILVMAAAYSDEVVKQIKSKYQKKFHIAVLRESGLDVLN